jgi:hypothetical protein
MGLMVVIVLYGTMLGWWSGLPAPALWAQARTTASLVGLEKKSLILENFRLQSGYVFPQLTLAYESTGNLLPMAAMPSSLPTATPATSTRPAGMPRPMPRRAGGIA